VITVEFVRHVLVEMFSKQTAKSIIVNDETSGIPITSIMSSARLPQWRKSITNSVTISNSPSDSHEAGMLLYKSCSKGSSSAYRWMQRAR
jgi:hypothetical protein